MDKIEKYKNLNEEVKKMLKDARETSPTAIEEEIRNTANEICEALEDPNRVTALMRSGLLDSGKISRVRSALKDPEKAVKNPAIRMDLINMLMSLINIVTSNPSAYATVKKGAKVANEPVTMGEELIGGQKKLDVNKNGKVDGEDLAALRAGKKKVEDDEEIEEELIGGQKKLDVNKNGKVDGADLAALRAGKKKS